MSIFSAFRSSFVTLACSILGLAGCTSSEVLTPPASARSAVEATDPHFKGVTGCFTMIELGTNATVERGGEECGVRTLPASTFKIPNALIALETGVVEENTVIPWDGKERWNSHWNQDLSLPKAMWYSAVPYFQTIAGRVGVERYRAFLSAFQYGNADPSGDVTMFWLNGVLQISPREETRFLAALYDGKLPVSTSAMASVKRILQLRGEAVPHLRERLPFVDQIPQSVILSGKTGSDMPDEGMAVGPLDVVGWFVGALERDGKTYVFACRIRSGDRSKIGPAAAQIVYEILKEEHFL